MNERSSSFLFLVWSMTFREQKLIWLKTRMFFLDLAVFFPAFFFLFLLSFFLLPIRGFWAAHKFTEDESKLNGEEKKNAGIKIHDTHPSPA